MRWGDLTLGSIACFVILGEPTKIDILHPRNPLLVLLVVGSLSPLHCEEYQTKLVESAVSFIVWFIFVSQAGRPC